MPSGGALITAIRPYSSRLSRIGAKSAPETVSNASATPSGAASRIFATRSPSGVTTAVAPSARTDSLSSCARTIPMTRAPRHAASCTAALPTAPVAPETRTVSPPASWPAVMRALYAVTNATPTAAASSNESPSGFRANPSSGTVTYCACVPFRVKPRSPPVPNTSTPRSSGGPATIVPAKSRPTIRGSVVCAFIAPCTFFASLGLIAAARTRTMTSPAECSGCGTSLGASFL